MSEVKDMEVEVPLDWVQVIGRFRQDLGDVDSLSRSILDIGLINPITVTPDGRLVAGQRRLEAVRRIGMRTIPARMVESLDGAVERLTAERDENTERKPMTPEELVSLGKALEDLERPRAAARKAQASGLPRGSKGVSEFHEETSEPVDSATPSETPGPRGRSKTDDAVGKALGVGSTTYYRAKTVVNAANDPSAPDEVREVATAALADMNETGNISGNYEKVRQAKAGAKPSALIGNGRRRGEAIAGAAQQRKALTNAVNTLSGMAHGLALIDPIHPDIQNEEAAQWVDGLSEARRVIESLIKRLRAHTQGGS